MKKETKIHPTAIIEKGAELGIGVKVGPFCIIGSNVRLDDGVVVDSHSCIRGNTTVGSRTRVWSYASLGTEPQDLKYQGEETSLEIGEDNKIREYVNLSIGTEGGGGKTIIGHRNLLMVNVHVAHDCIIGDDCIIANGAAIAGHVEVESQAVIGGLCAIHQFCKIGTLAMLAGGSIVVQDVPPFVMVSGNHASPKGLNLTGLRRKKMHSSRISEVKMMYKFLYRSDLTIEHAIAEMEANLSESEERLQFVRFLEASNRGICR
ncbi:MAG: acyl-ACP--UDP-N-acetylglucosamine O-acyltransferase [Bdellovibrionota bacterium]